MSGLIVERVMPESIAYELEVEPGDRLLSINGHILRDVIDYNYFGSEEFLTLEIEKGDGELWEVEVEREEGESLGLIFTPPEPARCGNNCVFCFVHQLPKGLRTPLYVKDEDYRLSFLYGNYVTLANVSDAELERIKEQRLSPIYISVHATDPGLRERLLGKKRVRPILGVIKELAQSRIMMHCQVVLCPGLNDGAFFAQTVAELCALYPFVASLAVVPVGITSHRDKLPPLIPVDGPYARAFIEEWGEKSASLAERLGEPFLFLADEFYLKAEFPFPELSSYGDLPQLENGVGMIPLFLRDAREVLDDAEKLTPMRVTVITGDSPFHYLATFLEELSAKTGVHFSCRAVPNRLFGPTVTVTGLVGGRDIISELKGSDLGELVMVPEVMLKEGEGVFLDDLAPEDVESALGVRVVLVEASPFGIYEALSGECAKG